MAGNRFPIIVPCHRVISASGAVGNYSGPDGVGMKRRLLALEGVIPADSKPRAKPAKRALRR
jgi:methylated-DNA-[protein]-cysteine S-methyltransferase